MGFLRLYLALCVLLEHAHTSFPWASHAGSAAVETFFVISGFYMAMIAPRYATPMAFYTSRFLRIFVPYWAVAAAIVGLSIGLGLTTHFWASLTPYLNPAHPNGELGQLLAAISNVTLFGQDLIMFLQHDAGSNLTFTANFRAGSAPLYPYLIIPQAWSIAVELTFYLMVPWLARRRTRTIIALVLMSLAARVYAYGSLGLSNDPWNYRFFPFEFAWFGLGMLSWQLCQRLPTHWKSRLQLPAAWPRLGYFGFAVGLLLLLHLLWSLTVALYHPLGYPYAQLLSCAVWVALLPGLFLVSRHHRFDRLIGELSYPIYLIHLFIVKVTETGTTAAGFALSPAAVGAISAGLTIAAAYALTQRLVLPLDRLRYAAAARWGAVTPPAAERET